MPDYRPEEYWQARLARRFSLGGVGHQDYSDAYNAWLYRAKRRALRRGLAGAPRAGRALDVGSGVGWVVGELRGLGFTADGVDIAPVAVERLAARFPDARFFRAAVGTDPLPVATAGYDVVTLLDVAYHVTDEPAFAAAVAELGRVLAPGGRLLVTDALGAEDRAPAPHVRFRSRAAWEAAAGPAGLRVERVLPLYRWLSRDRGRPGWRRLPDRARGALEYGLELTAPRPPHLRLAVLRAG